MVPHRFCRLKLLTKAQPHLPKKFEIRAQMFLSGIFFYTAKTLLRLSFILDKMNLGITMLQAWGLSGWNLG